MQVNSVLLDELASSLVKAGYFPTKADFDKLVKSINGSVASRNAANAFSISQFVRGLAARQGKILNERTKAADLQFVDRTIEEVSKALDTQNTPGSFLVPTIQADAIIAILQAAAVLRVSGATVWPMAGIQKLNIPTETATPTVEFLGDNTAQTPSDPGLGQVPLNLKRRRSLTAIPNALLRVSVPQVDSIITALIAKAFAKNEDTAFFGASQLSGGPLNLLGAAGTTSVNQAGATLAFDDLTAVMAASAEAEAVGPFAWYMSPSIFFGKVLGLKDNNGRPLITDANPIVSGNVAGEVIRFKMFGEDVFVTPRIPNTLGASSNESYICRANPAYFHVGDSGGVEVAVSLDRFFDQDQIAIRATHGLDYGYGPAAGIVVLQNVK